MTTETVIVLDDEYADVARNLRRIVAERKDLEEIEKRLKVLLRNALHAGQTGVDMDGVPLVRARRVTRFDVTLAAQLLPELVSEQVLESIQVKIIDATRAREILAPAIAALCQREYDAAIEIV